MATCATLLSRRHAYPQEVAARATFRAGGCSYLSTVVTAFHNVADSLTARRTTPGAFFRRPSQ